MTVIDMQTMRYINLLDRTSRVKTSKCFVYNNVIVFAVPGALLSRAIGPGASNVRSIQEQIGRRIKVIKEATGIKDAGRFVADIVAPVQFTSLEEKEGVLILTAGPQSKAALIGRNRRREEELKQIVKNTFGVDLRIV